MQPSNGILKPNKKLMRLTVPKAQHWKWDLAVKVGVVIMLLACIITPIVRHYLVYWINVSTHSSPEDPYIVINGFAETEDEYDPFIQDMRSSWDDILAELDEKHNLDAVKVDQSVYPVESYYDEPQPHDLGRYVILDIIYFHNEEDTRAGLISLGNYYVEQGYATYLPETFHPHQKFYPEAELTDEENAQLEKDFIVEPVERFMIWKESEDMSLTAGTQAQANEAETYGEAGAHILAYMNDDNSITVTYQAFHFPLSTLPKFEGNVKLLDMDKLDPSFNMMDGTYTSEPDCPRQSSTFTGSGWDPKYGCLDD